MQPVGLKPDPQGLEPNLQPSSGARRNAALPMP